jgi:hypothetical protein
MTQLTDLGFVKDEIAETIVSTYNARGQPNAAPIGATMLNEQQLSLKVFHSSDTYKNLQTSRAAVINITSNIDLFYRAALKETNPNGNLPQNWFQKSQTVNAPKLCAANAVIETLVGQIQPIAADRSQVICHRELITAASEPPKAYSRAFGATMESIVHVTRVKAFISNKSEQHKITELLALIRNCSDVVNRTAPNSRYSEIMADLAERINSWRAQS